MNETRRINLHLPTGWNNCIVEELEIIASVIVQEQALAGRYRPFIWERVKLHIVLAINDMRVLESDGKDGVFLVQRGKEKPFSISTGQLADLCERLNWLTDEKTRPLFMFPYQEIEVQGSKGSKLKVQGPAPLLDGYTWREYRLLTDWMQEYMRLSNAKRDTNLARNEFLAVLFRPVSTSGRDNEVSAATFADLSPVKWQVILFWWSSLMQQLAKKFPRVFKQQSVGQKKRVALKQDTPWDFYNRVTATVQKYVGGLSAQDVDSQPYGVTLQQLEMMADEAAEMEKIKQKHK